MDNFQFSNEQLNLLLARIRRVNIMLWAFDYRAAEIEIDEIDKVFHRDFEAAQKEEEKFRQIKHQVQTDESSKIRAKLSRNGLKGERLQVETQSEIISKTIDRLKNIGFEPTSMSLSPLASIVDKFKERVKQAKAVGLEPFYLNTNENLGRFFHIIEKRDNAQTQTVYRAYRLDKLSPITVDDLHRRLNTGFQNTDWRILSSKDSPIFKFRTFLSNAMATLVVYDQERYRLEIIHDQDPENEIAISIAEQIRNIMNDINTFA